VKATWKVSISFALVALALGTTTPASAVIMLTYDDSLKDIQQTQNSPCVIGSPSCDNSLPYTTVPGGPGDKDLNSPTYTVAQLTSIVGSTAMNLLIDVNQSGGDFTDAIQLDLVEVFVNNALIYELIGPQASPTAGSLNGNGFSDAGLRVLDFSSFLGTATVDFHIAWSHQTDGQESFFLAATNASPVPEPASMVLLGSGLASLGGWRFRKRNRA